jgi:hypothetical protein
VAVGDLVKYLKTINTHNLQSYSHRQGLGDCVVFLRRSTAGSLCPTSTLQ